MEKKIYLAGGCFWGTEHLFSLVDGVVKTAVGYANSNVANPSYEMVRTGGPGHVTQAALMGADIATVTWLALRMDAAMISTFSPFTVSAVKSELPMAVTTSSSCAMPSSEMSSNRPTNGEM